MPKQPLLNRQRSHLLVALFVLLASIYMITYSARIESSDTRRFLDTVSSFADYGDFYLDLSNWQFPSQTFDAHLRYPLQTGDVEPLQVIFATPLYLLAKITPGIGLVVLVAASNRIADLKPLAPSVQSALESIAAGDVVEISA